MASIYSVRFIAQADATGPASTVVPVGSIGVVRCITTTGQGSDLDFDVVFKVNGVVIHRVSDGDNTEVSDTWDGRVIANAGEEIAWSFAYGGSVDLTVSGYLLAAV